MSARRWTARFVVTCSAPEDADRLLAVLAPEAAREVPKTRAALARPTPTSVTIDVEATDAGALRAAANTYLGWVDLAENAAGVALRATSEAGSPKPLSP
ncbi:MAG TPA: KEOPS complex subunit Pcc1 [Thermoplasmata archaeon]|nr:KEOPS complex subunit Pcc1 [Thermoplasmata archaeon]